MTFQLMSDGLNSFLSCQVEDMIYHRFRQPIRNVKAELAGVGPSDPPRVAGECWDFYRQKLPQLRRITRLDSKTVGSNVGRRCGKLFTAWCDQENGKMYPGPTGDPRIVGQPAWFKRRMIMEAHGAWFARSAEERVKHG